MTEDVLAVAEDAHVLVVDDDDRLRDLLRRYLSDHGYRVSVAADAQEARAKLKSMAFDAMVLDVMMPGETGLELAADLKRIYPQPLPILMLTAMVEAEDRISGLESGADDYLTKPFEPRELLLRLNNIRRREAAPATAAGTPGAPTEGTVALGDAVFDLARGELTRDGKPVRLTSQEDALLRVLAERPGVVLSREDLGTLTAKGVGERSDAGQGRAIDVQVTRLRRKIEPDPRFPRFLQTVRGRGYVLKPE